MDLPFTCHYSVRHRTGVLRGDQAEWGPSPRGLASSSNRKQELYFFRVFPRVALGERCPPPRQRPPSSGRLLHHAEEAATTIQRWAMGTTTTMRTTTGGAMGNGREGGRARARMSPNAVCQSSQDSHAATVFILRRSSNIYTKAPARKRAWRAEQN